MNRMSIFSHEPYFGAISNALKIRCPYCEGDTTGDLAGCKKCLNWVRRPRPQFERRYGISFQAYLGASAKQAHKCAICETRRPDSGKRRLFHVDIDKSSGTFRGLLCLRCRDRLWATNYDPAYLRKLAKYLSGCSCARCAIGAAIGYKCAEYLERGTAI